MVIDGVNVTERYLPPVTAVRRDGSITSIVIPFGATALEELRSAIARERDYSQPIATVIVNSSLLFEQLDEQLKEEIEAKAKAVAEPVAG